MYIYTSYEVKVDTGSSNKQAQLTATPSAVPHDVGARVVSYYRASGLRQNMSHKEIVGGAGATTTSDPHRITVLNHGHMPLSLHISMLAAAQATPRRAGQCLSCHLTHVHLHMHHMHGTASFVLSNPWHWPIHGLHPGPYACTQPHTYIRTAHACPACVLFSWLGCAMLLLLFLCGTPILQCCLPLRLCPSSTSCSQKVYTHTLELAPTDTLHWPPGMSGRPPFCMHILHASATTPVSGGACHPAPGPSLAPPPAKY